LSNPFDSLKIEKHKAVQRNAVMARRDALPVAYREKASHDIGVRAQEILKAYEPFTTVAGYWPIRSEVDPRSLMMSLADREKTLALPCLHDNTLVFREWDFDKTLTPTRWDLHEPPVSTKLMIPDVVLVPLVAFDAHGNRLGYGKGYYDRALSHLRATLHVRTIGLAFECQREASIHVQSHDQTLDAIITEHAFYSC
jgi:5-formyltetrahydrofolate cyclo-ligase